MLEWQLLEKHWMDINSLGFEDGIIKSKGGFVLRYEGDKIQKALKKTGHSTLSFDTCECRKNSLDKV